LAAKAAGATKIVISDIKDDRLAVSKQLGATLTVNGQKGSFPGKKKHCVYLLF